MAPPGLSDHDRPGLPVTDLSPEARRKEALRHRAGLGAGPGAEPPAALASQLASLPADSAAKVPLTWLFRAREVAKRTFLGTYHDGFIHAGNLAYMAVLTIFPFFITGAAIFSALGEASGRNATIGAVLLALPPVVAEVIRPVAMAVVEQRSGWLLWAGGLVGIWTVGSLIETIRDILRRAYGTRATRAFWFYRLLSSGLVILAVLVLLLSLFAQVLIGAAEEVIQAWFPHLATALNSLSWSRIVPAFALFGSIYVLFYALTPAAYRSRAYPKWPGALLVTVWWALVTGMLPPLLRRVFSYDLTYGSLAGVMIALFFFWLVGLGMVMGAELNAALAETPEELEDRIGQADNRVRAKKEDKGG